MIEWLRGVNHWFEYWEPTWLFFLLSAEAIASFAGAMIIAKRLVQAKKYQRKPKPEYESLNVGEGK